MNFVGKAKRIEDIDLPRIGHMIGVGEDEIHAVLDVESAGSGFDSKDRPKMLFEPHIFYRELKNKSERDRAVAEGLAYPRWKRNYPADSYPRLLRAMEINETAALRSASWGLGQIMGFNHSLAGYNSVQEMVLDFMADEDNHLEAMVNFIVSAGLDDELRRHDWRGFARGYNGPGYAKNNYHIRLERAFKKWSRIKDTPWNPEDSLKEEKEAGKEIIEENKSTETPAESISKGKMDDDTKKDKKPSVSFSDILTAILRFLFNRKR